MLRMLLAATALAAVPLAAPSQPAWALPTIGNGDTINVVGSATFTGSAITFTNPADLTAGTGDFLTLGTCTGCVTMTTPLTYNPFTAGLLASATNAGVTATITLTGQNLPPSQVGNDLDINDFVTLTLTGFAPTPGTLDLSVNQATGVLSGSFSATAQGTNIPEPSTLLVFGAAAAGLIAYRALPKDARNRAT